MSAFHDSLLVEAESLEILRPYLEEKSDGRLVMTSKGRLARWLQESVGDAILEIKGSAVTVELKSERKHKPNLFLEVWSNKNLDVRNNYDYVGQNPGWIFKCRAEYLLYHFIDNDVLYALDVFRLKRWMFGYRDSEGDRIGALHSGKYKIKHVPSSQMNDTWGLCAPIIDLQNNLGSGMSVTYIKQRELEIAISLAPKTEELLR